MALCPSVKKGFSMVEILVALAIVAILAATIVPSLVSKMRDGRKAALSQTLLALSQGAGEYRKAITRYPSQLSLLTVGPTTANTDACGFPLTAPNVINWRGPYVSREMLSTGLSMGGATIQNGIRRATSGTATYLLIDATGVDSTIAVGLESEFDGGTNVPLNPNGGTIRYTSDPIAATSTTSPILRAADGLTTLSYSIPISGC